MADTQICYNPFRIKPREYVPVSKVSMIQSPLSASQSENTEENTKGPNFRSTPLEIEHLLMEKVLNLQTSLFSKVQCYFINRVCQWYENLKPTCNS